LTRRLTTIPGFGLILAHVVSAEVGRIERFRDHKALASYAGLAPRACDTGELDPGRAPLGRHLGERCQRTLKWAFIEAAHAAVRSGGRWRERFERVTAGGTRDRQRGYIKVARELVTVLYVVWSRQRDYQESPPRPGSGETQSASRRRQQKQQQQKQHSRSGTGLPYHPMVPAAGGRETSL
jgi:hypothetical protein